MNRWQELGLTPDEAQDEINDLTRENDALRRERDEAVARAEKAEAEVARLRDAMRQIDEWPNVYETAGREIQLLARAALEGVRS